MKCPSCGANIPDRSKNCEFCGSRISYEMQKERDQINKRGCPQCGSTNISFSREKQGEIRGKNGTAVMRATVGVCKDCGFTWRTHSTYDQPKKNNTWLWVLGWIFLFPVPLTILIWRSKLKPVVKYILIGVLWLFVLIIGMTGNSEDSVSSSSSSSTTNNVTVETSDALTESATINPESFIKDVKKSLEGTIASKDEAIKDVVLNNRNLSVYVDINNADFTLLTPEMLAESRTVSITDSILELQQYDNLWDTITVDFGEVGKIVNDKDNMDSNEAGRFFKSENFKIEKSKASISTDGKDFEIIPNVNTDNGKVLFGIRVDVENGTCYNVIVTSDGYNATDTATIINGVGYTAEFSTNGGREDGDTGEGLKGDYVVGITDTDWNVLYTQTFSF